VTGTGDEAHLAEYYYDEILAFVNELVGGNDDGELVYDALVTKRSSLLRYTKAIMQKKSAWY
jgi:hypothetical protein